MSDELAAFFTFLDQCCDANEYQQYGKICAESGQCYDDLRSMGAIYWYSIPFRLGLPLASTTIAVNLVLALLSALFSVVAIKSLLERSGSGLIGRMGTGFIFVVSAISHAVFFYPVLRFPLSDMPANFLVLMAIWLLLLYPAQKKTGLLLMALVGICLGLAAWTRAFFVYPVLVVVFSGLCISLYRRQFVALALSLALLPMAIQVYTTWQKHGYLSYLERSESDKWTNIHLGSKGIGYDVLLPGRSFYWYSSCENYSSWPDAIHNQDAYSLGCLLFGKLNFYLGSYGPHNYVWASGDVPLWSDSFLPGYRSSMGTPGVWSFTNMQRTENSGIGIDGSNTAIRLSTPNKNDYGEISQTVVLEASPFAYEFSVWLWSSEHSQPVSLSVREHDSKSIVAQRGFTLSPEQQVVNLQDITISKSGNYDVVLATLPTMKTGNSSANRGDIFSWEEFDLRRYMPPATMKTFRIWSKWILGVNTAAYIATAVLFIRLRKKLHPLQWLAPLLLLLSLGVGLLIIPEQRYVIAPMIAAWVFFGASVVVFFKRVVTKRNGKMILDSLPPYKRHIDM